MKYTLQCEEIRTRLYGGHVQCIIFFFENLLTVPADPDNSQLCFLVPSGTSSP